ncbi:MFS transporter [Kitasatospora cineracea]|uniref:MFS family arabinose efflux permease n=1 Tax=Kitasatospora cineracea TaxID=88074 RepID=A0A3N4R407_9ACTN|nr:MFS transporter [Kitasatospora cineracea]RPE27932.1 putative MFS family arabinose efflux permease [Kitasatospora cineracea]
MTTAPQDATATGPWQADEHVRAVQKRTVRLLAAAQIVGGVGIGVSVSIGSLLAESVAHGETCAGLARTATTAGAAAGVPLALLAQRRGRRTALSTGWLTAAAGGAVLIASAVAGSIPLLVAGMLLFGVGSATNQSKTGTLRAGLVHLRRTPRAALAFTTIVVANTVMGTVMTMTPVSMAEHGATLTVVGLTISGHLLGMYAFSPLVGQLADRIGHLPTVLAGQFVFLASALLSGLGGRSVPLVTAGLFLLGLGWSFSLVAGSALLSDATPATLRPGVQGTADTAMNVVAALGAGLAGPLVHGTGFGGLNAAAAVLVLPVIALRLLPPRTR